jgi:hypothetical protein
VEYAVIAKKLSERLTRAEQKIAKESGTPENTDFRAVHDFFNGLVELVSSEVAYRLPTSSPGKEKAQH